MGLEKLTHRDGTFEASKHVACGGYFFVKSQHALIQAVGYVKHTAQPFERVLFRGQRKIYGALSPTAYRGVTTAAGQSKRHSYINEVLDQFRSRCGISLRFDQLAHEPLLQHYGISTTWVDVVDNVWVALWFALHQAFSAGGGRYVHFDPRDSSVADEFGYILLIAVDSGKKNGPLKKGFMLGNRTETVDLRIAAPSVFVRPHAQHGLLFRPKAIKPINGVPVRPLDYSPFVRGIIKFRLCDGEKWLGKGDLHSVRALFPPPYHDDGYGILLNAKLEHPHIGSIHHIGA